MLARAPGDVAHADVAQVTVPRRQRGSPRPAWGNGAACPATPGANAHGVPRTAVTSANSAPSRPAGRVQPCRFDLLPPCTPITARHRTRRSDWASRAARIGPLPGDQVVTRQRCHRRTVPGVTSRCARSLAGRSLISAASTARRAQSHRAPARCGAAPRPRTAARAVPHPWTPANNRQDKPASKPHEDQIEQTQRHGRSSCPAATPRLSRQVTAIGRLLAPRGRIAAAPRPGRLLAPHTGLT
jgi:hypothetical protein